MLELHKPTKTKKLGLEIKYKVKKMTRFILKPFKSHSLIKKRNKLY